MGMDDLRVGEHFKQRFELHKVLWRLENPHIEPLPHWLYVRCEETLSYKEWAIQEEYRGVRCHMAAFLIVSVSIFKRTSFQGIVSFTEVTTKLVLGPDTSRASRPPVKA